MISPQNMDTEIRPIKESSDITAEILSWSAPKIQLKGIRIAAITLGEDRIFILLVSLFLLFCGRSEGVRPWLAAQTERSTVPRMCGFFASTMRNCLFELVKADKSHYCLV